jgi:hypothetical protein
MKEDTLSFNELTLAISAMQKQAKTLIGKGKQYDKLLEIILTQDYYDDNRTHYLKSQELQQLTGLSHTRIKKQMEEIHKDVFEIAFHDSTLFDFRDVEYDFYVKGYTNSISFKGKIPVLPRVGDDFEFPFLRALHSGRPNFFVRRIRHEFTDTKQIIHIWLESGIYNSYAKFKEDKDSFEQHERWLRSISREE